MIDIHRNYPVIIGKDTIVFVPLFITLVIFSLPPCDSACCFARDIPRPDPGLFFPFTNRSVTLSMSTSLIPFPSSSIVTVSQFFETEIVMWIFKFRFVTLPWVLELSIRFLKRSRSPSLQPITSGGGSGASIFILISGWCKQRNGNIRI